MSDSKPILYMKEKCPFCLKVRIAVIEAGLQDAVDLREFSPGTEEEATIKEELAPHFEKVTFPSAQFQPGEYMNDSDAVLAALLEWAEVDPAELPVLNSYVNGTFKNMMKLYSENAELKAKSE